MARMLERHGDERDQRRADRRHCDRPGKREADQRQQRDLERPDWPNPAAATR